MIRRALSLAVAVLVVLSITGSSPTIGATGTTSDEGGALKTSACHLLGYAGAPRLLGADAGHPASVLPVGFGCFVSVCLQTVTDPDSGAEKCQFGRGATLEVDHYSRPGVAVKVVGRDLGEGYKKVGIKGADLAGIVHSAKGGGLAIAVGQSSALFALGAYSDTDPNPQWGSDPRKLVLSAGRRIAKGLGHPGCPAKPAKCPGQLG